MSWKTSISASSPVWHGIQDYVAERTVDLTAICLAPESSEVQIRQAQAGVLELARLLSLPQMIAAETQIRSQGAARKEY